MSISSLPPCRWSQTFVLPWPPRQLHPNLHVKNMAIKWAAQKRYRAACLVLARQQLGHLPGPPLGLLAASVVFRPPDRIRRDIDNLLASFKFAGDAVAEVLGVDDSSFRPWTLDFGPPVRGGAVELTLTVPAGPDLLRPVEGL